jgi:hypothetical protein
MGVWLILVKSRENHKKQKKVSFVGFRVKDTTNFVKYDYDFS